MNYIRLERELKKRLQIPYKWGMKQNDICDRQTNFIYTVYSFQKLKDVIQRELSGHSNYRALSDYALNRWYNFWSAQGVEAIFTANKNVTAAFNRRDRLVDFTINGIPFDHKTSVFPKGYSKSLAYAQSNVADLIQWLYANQSQQQRKHLKNRLFVVLANDKEANAHWKLKAEILWLKEIIETYVQHFDSAKLQRLKFGDDAIVSDIIWAIKE